MHQQQYATEKLQKKFQSEIENKNRLLNQQKRAEPHKDEIDKLRQDNCRLLRECNEQQKKCDGLQQRLMELYEDAEVVRGQVNREIDLHRKAQNDINKLKKQNYILWRETRNQQAKFTTTEAPKLTEEDQLAHDAELELMASDSGIFKDLRLKAKQLVHQGV